MSLPLDALCWLCHCDCRTYDERSAGMCEECDALIYAEPWRPELAEIVKKLDPRSEAAKELRRMGLIETGLRVKGQLT